MSALNSGLTDTEVRAILRRAAREGPRTLAIAWTLASTGARVSEITTATYGQLAKRGGACVLLVHTEKQRRPHDRVLLLDDGLGELLVMLKGRALSADDRSPLIETHSGRFYHRNDVHRIVSALARRAGVRHDVWPHQFRHWFATSLAEQRVELLRLAYLLGHADPKSTMAYVNLANAPDQPLPLALRRAA